jgi:hypothetical protein
MHRIFWGTAAVLALCAGAAGTAGAHVRLQGNRPPVVNVVDTGTKIEANRISMFVTNIGSFAFDLGTGNSGLEFPKGTGNTAVFAAGLWLGATVAGETRVTVAEYSQEFVPGPMSGGTFLPDSPQYKVYRVTREDTTGWADWVANAAPLGAPVVDLGNGLQPAILGDETLWSVFNDADPGAHSNDAGASPPLGVEVQLTTFAFNRTGALGNTVFLKYLIINKGSNTLEQMYASIWSDPDLGGASDDLVGVDTTLSLGYTYNATNNDNLYGSRPPAVGFDFFKGPVYGGDTLGLASFNKYVNGTDPNSKDQSYNYMQGLEADGAPVIDPTTGQVTTFFHPGDPVARTGWLDTNPADRRLMLSAGPFVMAPGDSQEIVAAVILGDGRDRLSSVRALKFYDQFAQDAFDVNFDLPNPPPTPDVDGQGLDGTVVLTWGSESQVPDSTSQYAFEGYNIWQGESVAGPWKRIATYDIDNGIGTIQDVVFDAEFGDVVTIPVQFGEDGGIRHSIELTQDEIRGVPLRNGTQYYYSVTAYSYCETCVPRTLENSQGTAGQNLNAVIVMPQKPTAGTDLSVVSSGIVTQSRIDTNLPATTDVVTVDVINPQEVRNCAYEVYYTDLSPPYPVYAGAEVTSAWNLRRICPDGDDAGAAPDTTVLLADQLNKTGDADYQIVDGIQVKVQGAYVPALQDVFYTEVPPTAEARDLQPTGTFELAFYDGSADYANHFFDSTIDAVLNPEAFTTVEIRFDSTATSKAYRYFRDELAGGGAPPDGRGYYYGGFVDVNFQVWDVINNVQLDAAFVERREVDASHVPTGNILPTNDGTWRPSTEEVTGDREYLFVIGSEYTDTPKPAYEVNDAIAGTGNNPAVMPAMYVIIGHALSEESPYPDNGEKLTFVWANPGRANDAFAFNPTAALRDDAALAESNLPNIRVVPNPYYGRSNYERNQFGRQIRFMNLPATCTIRIFNLSGDLVRTLNKDDASTSVLTWDAQTNNALPVGSGIYIYQVEAPGVGRTHGRMVVFTEKERLNNF